MIHEFALTVAQWFRDPHVHISFPELEKATSYG